MDHRKVLVLRKTANPFLVALQLLPQCRECGRVIDAKRLHGMSGTPYCRSCAEDVAAGELEPQTAFGS